MVWAEMRISSFDITNYSRYSFNSDCKLFHCPNPIGHVPVPLASFSHSYMSGLEICLAGGLGGSMIFWYKHYSLNNLCSQLPQESQKARLSLPITVIVIIIT
jgi:hypothetical protein